MIFPKLKNELDSCADNNQLLPSVLPIFMEFEKECAKQGVILKTKETYRSYARQVKLHKENPSGSAEPGLSMHGTRTAKDYCINSKTNPYNTTLLTKAGRIWQKMGYVWGGDWNGDGKFNDKPMDMPHFQIVKIKDQDKIRSFGTNWEKLDAYIKSYILKVRKK